MSDIDKSTLSEADICEKFISPALAQAGWDIQTQIRREVYFTKGRIKVAGTVVKRGKAKFADYLLYLKPNLPLGIVEAKRNEHQIGAGMQQALDYAEILQLPFAFSSNGDGFLFHDRTGLAPKTEVLLGLDEFPTPEELWARYRKWRNITDDAEPIVTQDYFTDASGKEPRYYQLNAINRTVEAVAAGEKRLLLVMATGTGKTYTAFQIIWRLWKAKKVKRVLFLVDRNILADQTRTNDFKPFGKVMTKISKRKADHAFEIYLSLYQAITGPLEEDKIYKKFSPGFFDLIVVDECHRGSAADDSQWREVLDYFSSAIHLGMTATPKETCYVSNIDYFGKPIYSYTLKQGIEDGFLAPYKVIRVDLDRDLQGWRPEKDQVDAKGQAIPDRVYNQMDFDREIVLEKRRELVAKRVSEYLRSTNRMDKTIVFCEDVEHAEGMRQALVNENEDLATQNRKYVMRITGDNREGKAALDDFIDPKESYPVIATTSKLLSTGVDAKTCKLIVLDQRITSMTEFKQIIGRGTRVEEEYGKFFFTIMDFRNATNLFSDPEFDGEPVQIYQPGPDDPVAPPTTVTKTAPTPGDDSDEAPVPADVGVLHGDKNVVKKRRKFRVKDVEVTVVAERVQYFDKDGKLVTESLRDYSKKTIKSEYSSLDTFLQQWTEADQKQAIVDALEEHGLLLEPLQEEIGKDYGAFDLICHVAFDRPPLTRKQRAEKVRAGSYFDKYGEKARAVLDALLKKYTDEGVENLESLNVLKVPPLPDLGTPMEIIKRFGGKDEYRAALKGLVAEIYSAA